MSAETYRDDPDSRIANMELVLDENESNISTNLRAMLDSTIGAFIDCKDWSKIAEWNFDSIYGWASRHNEMCNMSLDKTKENIRQATRDDVGTEITINKLTSLKFICEAQLLNVRRSEFIVKTLDTWYKDTFEKSYVPKGSRKSATDGKDVNKAEVSFAKSELLKLVK